MKRILLIFFLANSCALTSQQHENQFTEGLSACLDNTEFALMQNLFLKVDKALADNDIESENRYYDFVT